MEKTLLTVDYDSKNFLYKELRLFNALSIQSQPSSRSGQVSSSMPHHDVLWANRLIDIKVVKGSEFDKFNWAESPMAYVLE